MDDTAGKHIKALRIARHLSQRNLAEQAGIHAVTLSRIEGGHQNPSLVILTKLADALNIKPEDLLAETPSDLDEADRLPVYKVPVINFVQAGEFHEYTDLEYPNGWADEFIYCTEKGPHVFALKIKGSSMEPDFNEGDIVVINPDKRVDNGDNAVVRLLKSGETTIKKVEYFDHGKLVILRPINHGFKPIEIKEEDRENRVKIIGRVMEVIRKF